MEFLMFNPSRPGYSSYVADGTVQVLDGNYGADCRNANCPNVQLQSVPPPVRRARQHAAAAFGRAAAGRRPGAAALPA